MVNGQQHQPSAGSNVQHCSEHAQQALKLYCEKCEDLICSECTIKGSEHHGHDYVLLDEALKKHKKDIESLLLKVEGRLTATNKTLVELDDTKGKCQSQYPQYNGKTS